MSGETIEGTNRKLGRYSRGHNVAAFAASSSHRIIYPTGTTTVNILKKGVGRLGRDGTRKAQWLIRADKAHHGTPYPHININSALTRRPDPHIRIPNGVPEAARTGAKALQRANKIMKVAGPLVDGCCLAFSGYKDYKNGTFRNTTTTAASIGGGYGGAAGGALLGAEIGTLCGPVGTLVGGIIGAIAGGIGGSVAAEEVVDAVGDASGYNIENRRCRRCQKMFVVRLYRGENDRICRRCRQSDE